MLGLINIDKAGIAGDTLCVGQAYHEGREVVRHLTSKNDARSNDRNSD